MPGGMWLEDCHGHNGQDRASRDRWLEVVGLLVVAIRHQSLEEELEEVAIGEVEGQLEGPTVADTDSAGQ